MDDRSRSDILRSALAGYAFENGDEILQHEARIDELERTERRLADLESTTSDLLDIVEQHHETVSSELADVRERLERQRDALDRVDETMDDLERGEETEPGDIPEAAIERVEKRLRGEECWTRNGGVDRSRKPGPGGKTTGGPVFPSHSYIEEIADSYGVAAPRLVAAVRDRYPGLPDHAFVQPDIDTEGWHGVDPDGYAVDSDGERTGEQYPELVEDIELDDVLERKRNDPRFSV